MITLQEFLKTVKEKGKRIIGFGTGLMAKEALKYEEIRKAVLFFVDNDTNLHGRMVDIAGKAYQVMSLNESLAYIDPKTIFLLTSGHYKEIREQMEHLGLHKKVEIYSFPELKIGYSANSDEFFQERILKECMKEYEIVLDQYHIYGEKRQKKIEEKKKYIEGENKFKRPLVLPRIMIMPTTRCNLCCKGCSSLLPFFKKSEDIPFEKVENDLDVFFSGVDECIRITIGGEPFLYPYLKELLDYLTNQNKVLGIMLITNSMLLPGDDILDRMRNQKIFVEISDYGQLDRMGRLVRILEENEINFAVLTEQKWTDMGGIEPRNRNQQELRFSYLNCEQSRVIKGIYNGKFFTCARGARMYAMGAYTSEKDYFELNRELPSEELRKKIEKVYYSESADACDYCDLGTLPARVIEAGIQMRGTLKKSAYTIVKREEYEELKRLKRFETKQI